MARSLFKIMGQNPNRRNRTCLCGGKFEDCVGPYAVFQTEMMDARNPMPVLSLKCAENFVAKANKPAAAPFPAKPAGK